MQPRRRRLTKLHLVISREELEELLALGHETRSFEVKGPGSFKDKAYRAKVARAAMAMGNLRDGGFVCLGIDDTKMSAMEPGLGEYLAEWSDFDDVTSALAPLIDPPVDLHLEAFRLSSGADVVVIQVAEFQDVPHICKRSYPDVLQEGQVYIRPRGKPESVPIPSAVEMRDLLDLATAKGVREWVRRAGTAGVPLRQEGDQPVDEVNRFADEYAAAWADPGPVLSRLLALGHTDIAVRPLPHSADRLPPEKLERFLEEHVVRLRGWPVPYIDRKQLVARHGSWIGQDVDTEMVRHTEAWRMCTSGQFLHRRALVTDLRAHEELQPTRTDVSGTVAVWDVLLYMVEVAEFAARAATSFEADGIGFEVHLNGVGNRQLITGDFRRDIDETYVVAADHLESSTTISTTTLLEDARNVGVALAQALLRQFGLDLPDQVLLDWQDEVFARARG